MMDRDILEQLVLLINRDKPQWMIVRDLNAVFAGDRRLGFSLFDDWQSGRLPFDRHQGFVTFRCAGADGLKAVITALCDAAKEKVCAIGNLWILIDCLNCTNKESFDIQNLFRSLIPLERRRAAFDWIVPYVRDEAYRYIPDRNDLPASIGGWMRFTISSDAHDYAHFLASLIAGDGSIGLADLFKLPPYLIGALVGFMGYRLALSAAEALAVTEEAQVAFLAAQMLNYGGDASSVPEWMSRDLVYGLMVDRAETVGLDLFRRAWTYHPQQTRFPRQQRWLRRLTRSVVTELLSAGDATALRWIGTLDLVDHVPLVLLMMDNPRIPIPDAVHEKMGRHILERLQAEVNGLAADLAGERCRVRITSTRMNLPGASRIARMACRMIVGVWPQVEKSVRNMLYAVRGLFYGGWHARRFASAFVESLLFVVLHAETEGETELQDVMKLIDCMDRTVMTPYVHLTEREETIWDDGFQLTPYSPELNTVVINSCLRYLLARGNDESRRIAGALADSIRHTSTTPWPFERERPE